MELTKLRLEFDAIIGYNNREFNDILWAWVKRNSSNISNLVEPEISENTAAIKQAFYVTAKIQSKKDLKCVFTTDHLVHLGDLPINQIEHAIYDEVAKRIKERENDNYEILAITKIMLALDNPPEA